MSNTADPGDADIFAVLEAELGDLDLPEPGQNVAEMNDVTLVRYFQTTRQQLLGMGEMLGMVKGNATEEAKDLHLRFDAAQNEIRKRGYKH